MQVKIAGRINLGIVRKHQEDKFIICTNLAKGAWQYDINVGYDNEQSDFLFVVSDGMGGANAGEVASSLAVTKIQEFTNSRNGQYQEATSFLHDAILYINEAILDYGVTYPESSGMGATILLGLLHQEQLHCAWVGDSRIYRLSKGRIEPISKDHSYVQTLVDKREITEEEAFSHPRKNVITQSLGMTTDLLKPDTKTVQLSEGDRVLFCTDGLNGMLRDREIGEILNTYPSLDDTMIKLIEAANFNGGLDNITVVGFQLGDFQISENTVDTELSESITNEITIIPKLAQPKQRARLFAMVAVLFACIVAGGIYYWETTRNSSNSSNNASTPNTDTITSDNLRDSSAYVDTTIKNLFNPVPKNEMSSDEKDLNAQLEKNQKLTESIKTANLGQHSTPPPKKDTLVKKAAINSKGYIIQTGAYSKGDNVKQEVTRLEGLKLGKKIEIIQDNDLSKVMITKFDTEEEANAFIKKYLKNKETVIKPL